jgi:hypothetical protein
VHDDALDDVYLAGHQARPARWPTGPSSAGPCAPGYARQHYCRAEHDAGRITWVCVRCGMRYRFGEGEVLT